MNVDRERAVTDAFVALATSLADGVDVVDLLSGLAADTTRLLNVALTGMLLADHRGVLHLVAASSQATQSLQIVQLRREQGPCLDCYRSGPPVNVSDLRRASARWPLFAAAATEAGFFSAHAVPMRSRDTVLGAVGFFGTSTGALSEDDRRLGQALTYVAAVALVQGRAAADAAIVNVQLQRALDSRVVLEQAKGILAEKGSLPLDRAFAVLRHYARDHNLRLTDVAQPVATHQFGSVLLTHAAARDAGRPPTATT